MAETKFSCEPGKYLTVDETADMLAFDDAGLRRPEQYNDVVFDGTNIRGAGYRCKTEAEKKADEETAEAAAKAAARAARSAEITAAARAELQETAAMDQALEPLNLGDTGAGTRNMGDNTDAGKSTDEAEQTASGDTNSGAAGSGSRRTRSS